MRETLETLPRLRRPAAVNAAEYWMAPERFTQRCGRLGDRFVVPMPATGPWLCLTDPDDIKRVFTADTNVLRFGAALVKTAPHELLLGPTGLTTADGPEHARKRRMQLPAFRRKVLAGYEEVMQRKTEETLAGLVFDRPARAHDFMQEISLEVIIAAVFGMTEPARVKRLRTATLALMREAGSRRFLLQTIIATTRRDGWDGPFPRIRRAVAAVDAVVLEEVNERKRAGELERDDVLGMFLRATDDHGRPMPDNELCDAMRTLLIGGHETTASTLAWILERAVRHPDVVARLNSAALDGDDDYIDAVIQEGMRLRPVFPMTTRLATEPFELPGLTIPGRHHGHPLHHARAPPRRPLPRPAHLPPRALPRYPRRHLHLDSLRRRSPALHRCHLRTDRSPHRLADDAAPRGAPPHPGALRTNRPAQRHDRPRPRRTHHPEEAATRRPANARRRDNGRRGSPWMTQP